MDAIIKDIVDGYIKPIADKAYKEEMKIWNKERRATESVNYKQLRNPQFAQSLGLPEKLPAYTRNILKRTMALDKLSSSMPERPKVYRRYGL